MLDDAHSVLFVREALPMFRRSTVVLDALAMSVVGEGPFTQPVIVTPHAGEMAHLSGLPKEAIIEHPLAAAREAAQLERPGGAQGRRDPHGAAHGGAWGFSGGDFGIATSGSGDTLVGLIGGFAARCLPPLQACGWLPACTGR